MDSADFVSWFRDSTPYISAHRGKTFVVMLGADAVASANLINMAHDLALLHVLGARLVIVHGAEGLDTGAAAGGSDLDAMAAAVGVARNRLEALFSTGIPTSPLRGSRITLAGGNFVTAKPVGVIDGVERGCRGEPRRIHADELRRLLMTGAIVLLPPIGYSPSGQAYALAPETLAAKAALALRADKLIVYDGVERVDAASELTLAELEHALGQSRFPEPTQARLEAILHAGRGGVPRCHLISHAADGALLQELFTAEGVGTQIAEGDYRAMRSATAGDVAAIVELIRPLEEAGLLVRRPRDRLEAEVERFFLAEIDGIVIGCCALYPHGDAVELACLATHPSHRFRVGGKSLGERILSHAEEQAARAGFTRMFALTTRAADWFADHGFSPAAVEALPASRQALYNFQRNSKAMLKELAGARRPAGEPPRQAAEEVPE